MKLLGGVYDEPRQWWTALGLEDYDPARVTTRLEAAVVIDAALDPFGRFEVDYDGNIIR